MYTEKWRVNMSVFIAVENNKSWLQGKENLT